MKAPGKQQVISVCLNEIYPDQISGPEVSSASRALIEAAQRSDKGLGAGRHIAMAVTMAAAFNLVLQEAKADDCSAHPVYANNGETVTGCTIGTPGDGSTDMRVSSGGSAVLTTINSGGVQNVFSGGIASSTSINSGGVQFINSKGEGISTTVNSGGRLAVIAGGSSTNITQMSGGLIDVTVYSATDKTIVSGINEQGGIFSLISGHAQGFIINSGGFQSVSSGGLATSSTINHGGKQTIANSGSATSTIINAGGLLIVFSGGKSTQITQNTGGNVDVVVKGGDNVTVVSGTNETGSFSLSSGYASGFVINDKGSQVISSGGSATSSTINSGGIQIVSSGGKSTQITQNSGGNVNVAVKGGDNVTVVSGTNELGNNFSLASGSASGFVINNKGVQTITSGGSATSTIINAGGRQDISSGGRSTQITQNSGGNVNVTVYGSDNATFISGKYDGTHDFNLSNGVASGFVINSGGFQTVSSGGKSTQITQNSGGSVNVTVKGGDNVTVVSGTNEFGSAFSLASGHASGFVINVSGWQIISSGGAATSTTINASGSQTLSSGGSASLTTINSAGIQIVSSGGRATSTTINSGGVQNISSGGSATWTTINARGVQNVSSGGKSMQITQNSGGNVNVTIRGGDRATVVSGTNESGSFSLASGSASGFVINSGGTQIVSSGGIASSTTINIGGAQNVNNSGSAVLTTINAGGSQTVRLAAKASSTTINSGGKQTVFSGGTATMTLLNGGEQILSSGGSATSTKISAGGIQTVSVGAKSTQITQNSGGTVNVTVRRGDYNTLVSGTNEQGNDFSLASGLASNFVINANGWQEIYSGGSAVTTEVNAGGKQIVNSGGLATSTTINDWGTQRLYSGGITTDTTINSGGTLFVDSGSLHSGTLTAVSGGMISGTLTLANQSVLSGYVEIQGGTTLATQYTNELVYLDGNTTQLVYNKTSNDTLDINFSGTGGLTKAGTGTLTLTGNSTYTGNTNVENGTLFLTNSASLSASTVTIGNGATFNADASGHTIKSLSLSTGGTLALDLNGASNSGTTTNLTTGGSAPTQGTLNLLHTGPLTKGNYQLIELTQGGVTWGNLPISYQINGIAQTAPQRLATIGATMHGLIGKDTSLLQLKVIDANTNTSVTWTGGTNNLWDVGSANWTGNVEGVAIKTFLNNDTVIFNETGGNHHDIDVITGGVTADSISITGNGAWNFSGGKIELSNAVSIDSSSALGLSISTHAPSLTAKNINFNNSLLNITGYTPGDTLGNPQTVIETTNGITNFNPSVTIAGESTVDFLAASAKLDDTNTKVVVETSLAWLSADPTHKAHGTFTLNSGTFTLGANLTDNTNSNLSSGWDGKSLTKAGSGTLILTGTNNYTSGTTVSGGILQGNTNSLQGNISTADNTRVTFSQSTNGTYAGDMSGSGNLTKSGSGTLTLTGSNSYTGGTMVSGGILQGNTNSLQGNISTADNTQVAFNQSTNGTYVGNMSGTGGLTKTGNGTLTLTGNNTYTGGTTLHAGTLVLDGSTSGGSLTGKLTGQNGTTFGLINGAHFTGSIDPTNVSLNASQWTNTGNSSIADLNFQNNGRIVFDPAGGFKTLTISGNLTGSGFFALNTNLGNQQDDQLIFTNTATLSGNHTLLVTNRGGEPAAPNQSVAIIDASAVAPGKNNASFTLQGGYVDAGAYRYTLESGSKVRSGDANKWYLYNTGKQSQMTTEFRSLGSFTDMTMIGSATDLRKRMGELKLDAQHQGDLWTRTYHRDYRHTLYEAAQGTQKVSGIDIGADKLLGNTNGRVYVGGLISYGESDFNTTNNAKFDSEHYQLGFYATWLHEGGTYVDLSTRYFWFDRNYRFSQGNAGFENASNKSEALMIGLEAGHRIDLAQGWFIEPQAEVIMTRSDSFDIMTDRNNRLSYETGKGTLLRGGLMVGRTIREQASTMQLYAKVDRLEHLQASYDVSVNGNHFSSKKPDGSWMLTTGAQVQYKNLQFHLEADANVGNADIKQRWGINAGVRWMF